ncbi:uncharacterized protein F4812DRAFT_424975 [Daldinia caldariorum]|uniref:uncharacterized protein n=1 Tax=Daldinia caldariorum TaxID=326644 RepID=UPI0020081B2C|nr:uncharacterized protein F4812DRAFT_424975 [Daldinia caldariorum]KAI1468874.1 hypothetical protein F4812DRAFT_424975 [Daldinia caldariorum]
MKMSEGDGQNGVQILTTQAPVPRKKFAIPPVKNACLSCRASRTRCNGERPCASCVTKDRDCVYKPSRRGGPRIRKKARPLSDYHDLAISLPTHQEEIPQDALLIENYIEPGAGLKPLADIWKDSDAIYDNLFQDALPNPLPNIRIPMVRTYGGNDRAILNAYYIWIHPYFPILPPPETAPEVDQVSPLFENQRGKFEEPTSAISLAISAILALIPCPQDPSPLEPDSILWRRTYSQFFAKAALESIESETERPESSISPPRALDDSDDEVFREKFHSQVPLELESIIALDLLSVYEYAQRGNLKKMRARVGAALVAAMSQMLHIDNDEEDEYSEARRRTWWMTYICVCQGSIVSNTPPTFEVFASSFTAKYPTVKADPGAWPLFVEAQQAILAATQFVIDFNKARKEQSDMTRIFNRMKDLERILEPLITKSESWILNCPLTQPVDKRESVLSQSLRCIARIKLNSARIKVHRYCAFFDLAVFSAKHCDLKSTTEKQQVASSPDVIQLQSCCTTLSSTPSVHSSPSGGSVSPTLSSRSTPNADCCGFTYQPTPVMTFPFSTHQSSKICLKSALNIAQAFDSLPYPNPTGLLCDTPCYIGPNSMLITPRTMPSFACCAMQCSYALLMVKDRTETMYPSATGEAGPLVDNLRDRLQQGLVSILVTLENYATAFEALGGMRDQIRDKVDLALGF